MDKIKEKVSKQEKGEVSDEKREKKIINEGKIYAVIGYLWVLCFIPLTVKKDNSFAVHHGKNGLMLFLVWLGLLVISIVPFLGHIISFVGIIIIMILAIQGIIHSLRGEYWSMPFLGRQAEELNI